MARQKFYIEVTHTCGHTASYLERFNCEPRSAELVCGPCAVAAEREAATERLVAAGAIVPEVVVVDAPVAADAPIRPLTHTATGSVIAALERGIDVEARFARWNDEELSEEEDW